jgi:DNA-binding winged helix-turn-helix (wHTH) protein/Tol biopolymer transport system component
MNDSTAKERRIWRFGLYELDSGAARLTKEGNPVKVQDQPFRILSILLERAGQMVTRDELRKELWPEGTFVEFDGSLNTALMKLRAALNDDPDNPRFIETLPRRGYRFIAPVQVINPDGSNSEAGDATRQNGLATAEGQASSQRLGAPLGLPKAFPAQVSSTRKLRAVLVLVCALAVVAGFLWRIWPRAEARIRLVTQLTHTGKVVPGSKIVTDGTRVYFVSEEDGTLRLMQSSIHGGSAEKLSTPFDNTVVLDISPDRLQFLIGASPRTGEPMPVWLWSTHGGAPHRLGDVSAQEAAWAPTGNLIAFVRADKLFTVKSDGTDLREIGSFGSAPHSLVWSPDAKSLRFTQTDLALGTDEIWEIAADGGAPQRVFSQAGRGLHETSGAWAEGGRYFLFTAGSDSQINLAVDTVSNLWAARERSGFFGTRSPVPVQITHGPVSFTQVAALRTGERVFALGSHPQYQLIRFEANNGKSFRILEDAGATQVDYSPDGEWIVYALRQNGTLWKSRKDGSSRAELTTTSPGAYAPSWSPNGKDILFTAFLLGKQPQLYLVSSGGGVPRSVLPAGTPGMTLSGDWSPDGARIIMDYRNHDSGKESLLQILTVQSGAIEKLAGTEGFSQPRWSPDGKHLAAVEQRAHRILLSDAQGKEWSYLADVQNPAGLYWSVDGTALYFQDAADQEKSVFRVRMSSHFKEKVLGFGPWLINGAAQCHFTGVGPDGSIYATIDHGGTDLYALDLNLP